MDFRWRRFDRGLAQLTGDEVQAADEFQQVTRANRHTVVALLDRDLIVDVHAHGNGSRRDVAYDLDPSPLKWSDLRYVFDIQEDCNGKEAIQA